MTQFCSLCHSEREIGRLASLFVQAPQLKNSNRFSTLYTIPSWRHSASCQESPRKVEFLYTEIDGCGAHRRPSSGWWVDAAFHYKWPGETARQHQAGAPVAPFMAVSRVGCGCFQRRSRHADAPPGRTSCAGWGLFPVDRG